MKQEEYLKQRVDDQIRWMERKSKKAKQNFLAMKSAQIILAALIPFVTAYADQNYWIKVSAGLIGVLVVILTGLLEALKLQDLWNLYRATAERLIREKFLFETLAPPYDSEQPFPLFVQNIELILQSEKDNWKSVQAQKPEKKKE